MYSDADEVELLLNGSSVKRVQAGMEKAFIARFETAYEPGEIVAVAYSGGVEQSRAVLRTAGDNIVLNLTADRSEIRADDTDLAYVNIVLQDGEGNLASHLDRPVSVTVDGSGVLAGLGSARPNPEERFGASTWTTYDGRALAIVRPTGVGDITVTASAEGLEPATVVIQAGSAG